MLGVPPVNSCSVRPSFPCPIRPASQRNRPLCSALLSGGRSSNSRTTSGVRTSTVTSSKERDRSAEVAREVVEGAELPHRFHGLGGFGGGSTTAPSFKLADVTDLSDVSFATLNGEERSRFLSQVKQAHLDSARSGDRNYLAAFETQFADYERIPDESRIDDLSVAKSEHLSQHSNCDKDLYHKYCFE